MAETFSKKEKREKKAKKKQDKAQKSEERKANSNKGKKLEDMMAYLDENGNLTSVPPQAGKRKEVNVQDIRLGAAPVEEEKTQRKGTVSFFSEKGYGFIMDSATKERIFFHRNELYSPVKEGDTVLFEIERTPRGYNAIRIKKA